MLLLHLNDFAGGGGVIPGEQRETRNPGGKTRGPRHVLLDASFRWHDEIVPIRINEMNHYVSTPLKRPARNPQAAQSCPVYPCL